MLLFAVAVIEEGSCTTRGGSEIAEGRREGRKKESWRGGQFNDANDWRAPKEAGNVSIYSQTQPRDEGTRKKGLKGRRRGEGEGDG